MSSDGSEGPDFDVAEIDGACHCSAVRLRLRLKDGLHTARRCDCSFCRMRGAVVVSAPLDGLTITQGREALTLYQFGTRTAEHWFCSRCGIYTHHRRRSNPNEFGVNAACLSGVSPFDFAAVEVNDGVAHPADTGRSRVAGVLRFERYD